MALIEWTDNFSVNNLIIDQQHKKLVDLVNQLHDAMKSGKGKEALSSIFDELIRYTKEHFSYEEKLMESKNYPAFISHKKLHSDLTNQVIELKNKFDSGKTSLSIEVQNFLKNWLTNHILDEDKKYVPFIK